MECLQIIDALSYRTTCKASISRKRRRDSFEFLLLLKNFSVTCPKFRNGTTCMKKDAENIHSHSVQIFLSRLVASCFSKIELLLGHIIFIISQPTVTRNKQTHFSLKTKACRYCAMTEKYFCSLNFPCKSPSVCEESMQWTFQFF